MQTRSEIRKEMRRRFEEQVPALSRPDFVERAVRSLLRNPAPEGGCKVEVVSNVGTPRMTLRYVFDDGNTLYGKVFTDGVGLARYSFLRHLWENGFGPGSAERVPEPLGFSANENLLLMRAAPGRPLAVRLLQDPIEQLLPLVRAAARWLARLHTCKLTGIPCEPACDRIKVFELADRLGKAATGHPTDQSLLLDRLQRLRILAPAEPHALVPTHGQYSPANVFVDGLDVIVIDVDRLSLSDPAKDVAMFLFRCAGLRARASGRPGEAERLESEFLDAYREQSPQPLENLPYYTALFALNAFAKCAKDHAADDPVRRRAEAFHLDRFDRCFAAEAARQVAAINVAPPRADLRPLTVDSLDSIVTQHVIAHLPRGGGDAPGGGYKATVVQNTGTGRVTSRYQLDAATVVFAKSYADGLGAHSYRVQRAFWESGFGKDSKFRVPEPLAFVEEQNLVLMREGAGTPLASLLGDGSGEWRAGVRQAARWLAAFHRSSLRVGDPEPEWDSLKTFRLVTRLVKAAAARPSERMRLLELMQMLKGRFAALPDGRPVVQTHGRFHHDHVFLSADAVTVIDLDRSRPTDPAKDVAEFVRVLRLAAFRAGVEEALTDAVTAAFLSQYLTLVPEASVALPHYWLSFLVLSYVGHLRKAVPAGASAAVTAFHEREIRRVSEMRL
jgi:aminoglycoside phosphotransferase (APT) family kinase protein